MPSSIANNKASKASEIDWEYGEERPYGQLACETIGFFEENQWLDLTIQPVELSTLHRNKFSLNGRFKLWGHQWSIRREGVAIGTARMVLIQGQKNEIINTWVFPKLPSLLPVFAAELIAMGGQQRLSFIDIQGPGMMSDRDTVLQYLSPVFQLHRQLRIDEAPPEWAVSDTLGHFIFRRTGSSSQFPEIASCYRNYLLVCLQKIWPRTLDDSASGCAATTNIVVDSQLPVLRRYQLHHLHSSPGNAFLSKLFGDQWTHDFLHNFLFSEP